MTDQDPSFIGRVKDYRFGRDDVWRKLRDCLLVFSLTLALGTPLYHGLSFVSRKYLPAFFERLALYISCTVIALELGIIGIILFIIFGSLAYFMFLQMCYVVIEGLTVITHMLVWPLLAFLKILDRITQPKKAAQPKTKETRNDFDSLFNEREVPQTIFTTGGRL